MRGESREGRQRREGIGGKEDDERRQKREGMERESERRAQN